MAIAMNWGNALAQGILGGIAGYAGKLAEDQDTERKNQQAQTLEQMRAQSAMAIERAKQAMARPVVSSFDATDAEGRPIKRTIKQTFDANANDGNGGWSETELGTAPNEAAQKPPTMRNVIMGSNEATQQWNPQSQNWETVGTPGPRFNTQDPMGQAMLAWMQKNQIEQQQRDDARKASENATNTRMATSLGRRDADEAMAKTTDSLHGNVTPQQQAAAKMTVYRQNGIDPYSQNPDEQLRAKMANGYATQLGANPIPDAATYDPAQVDISAARSAPQPKATPAAHPVHGAIVRTGTNAQGQKIAQYADGTVAPLGQ